MIKSVIVTNFRGDSLEIILRRPEKSGLLITNIEGITPPQATINSTTLATKDGSYYNSAHLGDREMTFTFKIIPTDSMSIEESRINLYKYFPTKQLVNLRFVTDTRDCFVEGYVESCEVSVFSMQEAARVSIVCPDPYFYSSDLTVKTFGGTTPKFEFPFQNASTTQKKLIFGEIAYYAENSIYYTGENEMGMLIDVYASGEVHNFTFYDIESNKSMTIDTDKLSILTGHPIIERDHIMISTVKGNKYAKLLRDGVTTNILNCLNKNAVWMQLKKGDNIFSYLTTYGSNNVTVTVSYRTIYEGI